MLRFCPFNLKIMEKNVEIREATSEDCQAIRALIQELADCEEMPDGPKIDSKTLEKDGFSSENPLYKCFVAVCDDVIVGYALYFYIYSTLDQKVLHLEDLYVNPEFRNKKIGSRLFNTVAKKTFQEKCSYLDFSVLSWNPAHSFYKNKGSVDLTEKEGWHMFRFTSDAFKKLNSSQASSDYTIRQAELKDYSTIKRLAQSTNNKKIEKNGAQVSIKIDSNPESDPVGEKNPFFKYIVVESNDAVVGYALYCFSYSTWEGKSMYLQELQVSPNERESSMKDDLISAVVKVAAAESCSRIEFWVLDHQKNGQFYVSKGAVDLTVNEEWNLFRLFELPKKQET